MSQVVSRLGPQMSRVFSPTRPQKPLHFATFRSPDTRDAASAVHGVAASVDLRSPDTRDAAATVGAGQPAPLAVDLRSPDTRDVAEGRPPSGDTPPAQITVVRPGGFDWTDAGIGAGAGAGLALLVVGTSLLVRLGRTEARPA